MTPLYCYYYIACIGLQTLKSRRFGKIRQGASNVLKSQKTKNSSMNATTYIMQFEMSVITFQTNNTYAANVHKQGRRNVNYLAVD